MSNWIPVSERMPTREDADEHEQVVVKFSDDGPAVTYPYEFKNTPPDEWMYPPVAWLPLPRYTPPKPVGPDEVTVSVWPNGAMSLMHGHPPAVQVRYLRADLAVRKVKPLTEEEYAALLKGFYNGGHGITEAFNAVMAARGIEVGE